MSLAEVSPLFKTDLNIDYTYERGWYLFDMVFHTKLMFFHRLILRVSPSAVLKELEIYKYIINRLY